MTTAFDERMAEIVFAEDITISRVVLAGWRIERTAEVGHNRRWAYMLLSPIGQFAGYYSTRYTAAVAAEQNMGVWEGERGLLP